MKMEDGPTSLVKSGNRDTQDTSEGWKLKRTFETKNPHGNSLVGAGCRAAPRPRGNGTPYLESDASSGRLPQYFQPKSPTGKFKRIKVCERQMAAGWQVNNNAANAMKSNYKEWTDSEEIVNKKHHIYGIETLQ